MLAAVVVAVAFDDLRAARFPLLEFVVVLADDVQPLVDAGAGVFHYFFSSASRSGAATPRAAANAAFLRNGSKAAKRERMSAGF